MTTDTALTSESTRVPPSASEMSDEERATQAKQYLDMLRVEDIDPLLMPSDPADSKCPLFASKGYSLDSDDARSLLHTVDEAVEAIQSGQRGFLLFAGIEEHRTERLAFGDHDDLDLFPTDVLPKTLTVTSGSGGRHTTFIKSDDIVKGASGEGGSLRVRRQSVVVPGSIHHEGTVYVVTDARPPAGLDLEDLPEWIRSSVVEQPEDPEGIELREIPHYREFVNREGIPLSECRSIDPQLNRLLTEHAPDFSGDASKAELALVNKLSYHHFTPQQCADIFRQYRPTARTKRKKKPLRSDYVRQTVEKGVHEERWNYHEDLLERVERRKRLPIPHDSLRDSSDSDLTITLAEGRERTRRIIEDAFVQGDSVVVEALPAMGKSYGSILAAKVTETPVFFATARTDLYAQLTDWAEDEGLSVYRLPSLLKDCPTATGEHGSEAEERVKSLYHAGVGATEIHTLAYESGDLLPCQRNGCCPYRQRWAVDLQEYDVLIGNYKHAYAPTVVDGRAVVIDEFPEQNFQTELNDVNSIVSSFCRQHDDLPLDTISSVFECRGNDQRRRAALDWLEEFGIEPDGRTVATTGDKSGHVLGPILVYGLLTADVLDNNWWHARLRSDNGMILFAYDDNEGQATVLRPPDLSAATAIVCLDGTPTLELWRLVVSGDLEHRPVLLPDERRTFFEETLGYRIIQTTEYVKPYGGPTYIKEHIDAALIAWVAQHEGRPPAVISSRKAIKRYETADILSETGVTDYGYYGNVKGSNAFGSARVGIVCGSPHYGDPYIECWGALAGHSVTSNGEKGVEKSYGEFGDAVLHHMREHEVLQAAMRFGRDSGGATVYVHTAAIPSWVPIITRGDVVAWNDGTRELIDAFGTMEGSRWRTDDLAEEVSTSSRTVRTNLAKLYRRGYIERAAERCGWTYYNPSTETLTQYGTVDF